MPDPGPLLAMNGASPAGHVGAMPPPPASVDLQKLAEKVYALMVAEARLGRARADSPSATRRSAED